MKATKSNYELEFIVINKLMAAQSMLNVFPNEIKMGEFLTSALKNVPGVDKCSLCIRYSEQMVGDPSKEAENILQEIKKVPGDQVHLSFDLPVIKDILIFPLQTSERLYGYVHLSIKSYSLNEYYKSAISNFINMVSMELENRWQKTKLVKHSKHLEELVKERTVELETEIKERKQGEEELKKHREHLEKLVKDRTAELEKKNAELKRFNKLFIGREFRIKELRDKVKELEKTKSD